MGGVMRAEVRANAGDEARKDAGAGAIERAAGSNGVNIFQFRMKVYEL
jgi:hypothetical protein